MFDTHTADWNETRYADERFDRILLEARSTVDFDKRKAMYCDMQRILHEEGGYIALAFRDSHDISTVARIADTIAVMQNGEVVEYGSTGTVLRSPHHPYTELLLKSVPDMRTDWLDTLEPLGRGGAGVQRQ